jgi:hypothetical protein
MTAQIRDSRGKQLGSQRSVNDAQVRPYETAEAIRRGGRAGLGSDLGDRPIRGGVQPRSESGTSPGSGAITLIREHLRRSGPDRSAAGCPEHRRVQTQSRGNRVKNRTGLRIQGFIEARATYSSHMKSRARRSYLQRDEAEGPGEKRDRITDCGRLTTLSTSKSKADVRQCQALLRGGCRGLLIIPS